MIDFNDVPKVVYEVMNAVHEEEVELLNSIEALLESDAPSAEISTAVEELLDHTREHFANEERLMREVNFPAFRMHKNEHDKVLNEFQYVLIDWRNRKDNTILSDYFRLEVTPWLYQHILSMDTVTAEFIAMAKGAA